MTNYVDAIESALDQVREETRVANKFEAYAAKNGMHEASETYGRDLKEEATFNRMTKDTRQMISSRLVNIRENEEEYDEERLQETITFMIGMIEDRIDQTFHKIGSNTTGDAERQGLVEAGRALNRIAAGLRDYTG